MPFEPIADLDVITDAADLLRRRIAEVLAQTPAGVPKRVVLTADVQAITTAVERPGGVVVVRVVRVFPTAGFPVPATALPEELITGPTGWAAELEVTHVRDAPKPRASTMKVSGPTDAQMEASTAEVYRDAWAVICGISAWREELFAPAVAGEWEDPIRCQVGFWNPLDNNLPGGMITVTVELPDPQISGQS